MPLHRRVLRRARQFRVARASRVLAKASRFRGLFREDRFRETRALPRHLIPPRNSMIRGAQAALPAVLGSLPSMSLHRISGIALRRRQAAVDYRLAAYVSPSFSRIELTKMFAGFDVFPSPGCNVLLFLDRERALHLGRRTEN